MKAFIIWLAHRSTQRTREHAYFYPLPGVKPKPAPLRSDFYFRLAQIKEKGMVTFQRTQVVGAEFPDENTIRFNGIQEDHIYGMEISMNVRIDDGTILQIQGEMKRYTNFVCPQAISVLPKAVGLSLRKPEWDKKVMREIGRKGCEHLAEIVIECGRCLDSAVLSRDLSKALKETPELDQEDFLTGSRR